MNKEIKEILDEMINLNDYQDYKIYGKRANEIGQQLLDYITNLQQENERLKEELQQEKKDFKEANDYCFELKDYKSRCEKAIEYIKNDSVIIQQEMNEGRGFDGTQQSYRIYVKDYLLNILQNGSDSQ